MKIEQFFKKKPLIEQKEDQLPVDPIITEVLPSKKASFDNIKGVLEQAFYNNNINEDNKGSFRLGFLLEKKELVLSSFSSFLEKKNIEKKSQKLLFLRFLKEQETFLLYKGAFEKEFLFKYRLKGLIGSHHQRKRVVFSVYEENRRKAQNFKLKKGKDVKRKDLSFLKGIKTPSKAFESASKTEYSFENSSNNDSFINNTEEDDQSLDEKKETGESLLEDLKTKVSTLIKGGKDSIISFYILSLLHKTELLLSFLIFTKKRLFLFINFESPSSKTQGKPEEIDKFLLIKRGFVEDLSESGLILNELKGYIMKRTDIMEIHTRRYLLQLCAMELFKKDRSFFLICGKEQIESLFRSFQQFLHFKAKKINKANTSLLYITPIQQGFSYPNIIAKPRKLKVLDSQEVIKMVLPLWEEGCLSNFDYLMILNILSGRTYGDLSQYPVFPWVLGYSEEITQLDFNDEKGYRLLGRPMGGMNEEKAKQVKEHYENVMKTLDSAPFHYGSHYSNPVVILYYLIRLMPYSEWAKDLQGRIS